MSVDLIKARELKEGDVFSHDDDGESWMTVVAVEDAGFATANLTFVYTEEGEVDLGSDDYVYVKD